MLTRTIAPLLYRIIQRRVHAYDNLFSAFIGLKFIPFSAGKAFTRSVTVTLPSSRCVYSAIGKAAAKTANYEKV